MDSIRPFYGVDKIRVPDYTFRPPRRKNHRGQRLQTEHFLDLISRLTGTSRKAVPTDIVLLERILSDDTKEADYSEFNELLLLVNKDRVSRPFFHRYFGSKCRISQLARHIEQFQVEAMLRYGNFVFAYRTLSRIQDEDEFLAELGKLCTERTDGFSGRSPRLLEIEQIPRDDTALLGYLSTAQLAAELGRRDLLKLVFKDVGPKPDWSTLLESIKELTQPEARQPVLGIVENFRSRNKTATVADFERYLESAGKQIQLRHDRMTEVQAIAIRNQDIYLTWDHMDVYFATSMRKPWEFTDLYDFVNGLMKSQDMKDLPVSFFDPTQSYTKERVDKGLVESLMLKRASCTVYSVQDTDTLGKDSELAATLAQGKPVIAYVPSISELERMEQLLTNDPASLLDRLRFVLYADERFLLELTPQDVAFVEEFPALNEFTRTMPFRSIQDAILVDEFRKKYENELKRLAAIVAASEKRIYDGRANTLSNFHPLGIQVNLSTGVANGVLVVRSIEDCAKLLNRVLTSSMEFDVLDEKAHWSLRERISGSIFRVVTKNLKVNNCFWNFYLR